MPEGRRKPTVTIRTFEWPDEAAVIGIWRDAGFRLGPSEETAGLRLRLQRDPELFLVATGQGSLVGAVLGGFDGRRGWVYHLAVAATHRRRGIGAALLTELESRLRALGCVKVNLLVQPANAEVGGFHEHAGYRSDELVFYEKWLATDL